MSVNGTTPDQIEAEIARQREDLATTVNQLQAKLDVKGRARHKAAGIKERATTATGKPRPDLTVAVVAATAVVAGLLIWRRRH